MHPIIIFAALMLALLLAITGIKLFSKMRDWLTLNQKRQQALDSYFHTEELMKNTLPGEEKFKLLEQCEQAKATLRELSQVRSC